MRKIAVFLAVALIVSPAALRAQEMPEQPPAPLQVGDEMFDFTLKNGITGENVNFTRDIKGKARIIAVAFFNTGCSACIAEMDEMSRMAVELGEEAVRVYGIAVDRRGAQAVKAYNEIYGYKVTYLLDPTFSMPPRFGFTFTPSCLLLDDQGRIRFLKGGFDPVREAGTIAEQIRSLLQP